jgi:hypothetical protein
MKWTHMAIGEAISDDVTTEIVTKMREHVASNVPQTIDHSILVEESGRMVILITEWPNRQDCLTYHTSKAYRQLVVCTQHMLVGNYIVKLFHSNANGE